MALFETNIFKYNYPPTHLDYLRNKVPFDTIPSSIWKFTRLLLDNDKDFLVTLAKIFSVASNIQFPV